MKVNDLPGARVPESNAPVSEVTVCGTESWLVKVTVVPALTVRDPGLKAKFWMVTLVPVAWAAGAGAVAAGALVGGVTGCIVG